MHTYQMPLVGLTINTDFGGHFNQALQYIIEEYDLTSPAELTMAIFVEYVEEFEQLKKNAFPLL